MDILFKKTGVSDNEALIVGIYDNLTFSKTAKKIDTENKGALTEALRHTSFTGKKDDVCRLFLQNRELLCIGLGAKERADALTAERAGARAVNALADEKGSVAFAADDLPPAAVGFGAKIASYRFTKYKTEREADFALKEFYVLTEKAQAAQNAYEPYFCVAKGIHTARDMVNEPANVMTPAAAAARAVELEKYGLKTEVYDEAMLKAKGFNLMTGVAQGSNNPPKLIVVQWRGNPDTEETHAVLVGKGVCFDSGGLSLKPAQGMEDMKFDLSGAAAVLGTLQALAMRKAKVNVAGVMAMVENIPSKTAQRPGDIVKSLKGLTVEVVNTDAEGRLVLADALTYAQERFKAPVVIDLATLTGAILVALGREFAGLFSNDPALSADIKAAADATGEKLWPMPTDESFDKQIVSYIADIQNTSTEGRMGGSCTAAAFLKRFIDDGVKWAHLDIAGAAWNNKSSLFGPKGGSGYGVRLLDRYIRDYVENKTDG